MRRREWLRLVGAGAASLAAGCGDDQPPGPPTTVAAVLEPDEQGFLVALHDATRAPVRVEVRDEDGALVDQRRIELGPSASDVVAVDGLAAAAGYEVTLHALHRAPLGPYRVRTAPRADDPRPVRLAVSADFDPHPMFDSALVDHVLAADPDLFVSLGDFPYCDNGPDVALDVPAYRRRHVHARASRALRTLHQGVGVRAIYDDHEFRNDWNPELVAREPARYAAALQVWDELFPLRAPVANVRYRSWRQGAHVECFLLDCRRFRSAVSAPDDARKTMLGATQLAWLVAGVRASSAAFKLVFTSVPLDYGIGTDHWKGYTHERDQLLAALVGVPGVLFVSADQHYFAAYRHAFGVREIQVGPLARGIGEPGDDAPGVLFRAHRFNAGVFDATAGELRVRGLGDDGSVFYEEAFTPAQLQPA